MSVVVRSAPLGNLATFALGTRRLERVDVWSDDLAKRVFRFVTSAGEIGLRLEPGEQLRDGDVIFADDERIVAVLVAADDVFVLRPASLESAIAIAHALGNRHLPIHVEKDAIVVRYDPLLEALAAEHRVPVTRESRVLQRPFRHAHAPHRHE